MIKLSINKRNNNNKKKTFSDSLIAKVANKKLKNLNPDSCRLVFCNL